MGLHRKRLALLHVAKKELQLGDDDWRTLLSRVAGVVSSADLSDDAFELVTAELKRLGFRSTNPSKQFGHRPGFATPAQIKLIRELWRQYHGPDQNEAALNAWLTRYHQVSALRFLSSEKAGKVLPALKAMVGRPLSMSGSPMPWLFEAP